MKLTRYLYLFGIIFGILSTAAPAQEAQQFNPIDRDKMAQLLPKKFAGGRSYTTPLGVTVPKEEGTMSSLKLMYAKGTDGVVAQLDVVHNTTPDIRWQNARKALEGESREDNGRGAIIELKLIKGFPAQIIVISSIKQTIASIALENGILISAKFNKCEDAQTAIDAFTEFDLAGFNSLR